MRDGYVIIRTYSNELEADLACSHLEALGLEAETESDNCGGMRPHLDYTLGVRLLVPADDAPYAREILADKSPESVTPAWSCAGCGEDIDAGFDVCWKCGQAHP